MNKKTKSINRLNSNFQYLCVMQFRKFTSLFLAILLLISNFGLAINVHYCGDKIASFSSALALIEKQNSSDTSNTVCCCVNDTKENNSCCKNKVVDLKKDSKDVIIKTFSFQIDAPFTVLKSYELFLHKAIHISLNSNGTEYYCIPNAPPLFKLYQKYIFYA